MADIDTMEAPPAAWDDDCTLRKSAKTATHIVLLVNVMVVLLLCNTCHLFVSRLRLPKIISEMSVGAICGMLPYLLDKPVIRAFPVISTIASSAYMFVLGLEMEPRTLFGPLSLEAKIAYSGIVTAFTSTITIYRFVAGSVARIGDDDFIFMTILASTSSPLVTRMATELKIGKSEIGRQTIRTGIVNDMVCVLLVTVISLHKYGVQMMPLAAAARIKRNDVVVSLIVYLAFEMLLVSLVSRFLVRWINERNAEGRTVILGYDMMLVVVLLQALCYSSLLIGFDTRINSLLVGLCLPREGCVSNTIISRTNYALSVFILPVFLAISGHNVREVMEGEYAENSSVPAFLVLTVAAAFAKMLGTVAAARWWVGMHWLEVITLAVLINVKGYFHIFMLADAIKNGPEARAQGLVMIGNVAVSIVVVPVIVKLVLRHVRARSAKARPLGLQWYNPESDLRMMVGLHSTQHVRAAVGLIEMMRGAARGMIVHATDMVELSSRVEATLVYGHGTDGVTVKDQKIVEMREEIGESLRVYVDASGYDGLRLRRSLAISAFSNMHEDICCTAQDSLIALIVLPFHNSQLVDGSMDGGRSGFRTVNCNVLKHANCSVAILVDRSGHRRNAGAMSSVSVNVAVVFLGGDDDYEALAFAGIVAQHQGLNVTVVRFIADEDAVVKARKRRLPAARPQAQTLADDEAFNKFYHKFIATDTVRYVENTVENGAELVRTLREMESEYHLFVVGQGGDRESVLTAGMTEWAEFPELGPIGDILAASDFSHNASVLVIQQSKCRKQPELIDMDFM